MGLGGLFFSHEKSKSVNTCVLKWMMLQPEIHAALPQRHSVACWFSRSRFLVRKQWQRASYLRTGFLDLRFHKPHWVSYTCIKVQGKKFLWKKSSLGANFFSRDPWKNFLPACIPGNRRLSVKISLKCLSTGKAEPSTWRRRQVTASLQKLLQLRREPKLSCWHTVLENDKRDCVH